MIRDDKHLLCKATNPCIVFETPIAISEIICC